MGIVFVYSDKRACLQRSAMLEKGRQITSSKPIIASSSRPLFRGSASASVGMKLKERWWSVLITAVISSGPAFLVGVTLGFPSVVLVEVELDSTLSDIFGVSLLV